jgi:hypothetical protein
MAFTGQLGVEVTKTLTGQGVQNMLKMAFCHCAMQWKNTKALTPTQGSFGDTLQFLTMSFLLCPTFKGSITNSP